MNPIVRLRVLLAALGLFWALGVQAQDAPTQVTIEQGRAMAVAAHQAHDAPTARALAKALLQRDPDDVLALQILAAASYALGDYETAQSSAKRAYRLAKTKPERHDSARIVAEALFKQNHLGGARLWLRRASDLAPDAATRASDIRAFQGIGQRMPLKVTIGGSVAPSKNVNAGSVSTSFRYGPFVLPIPAALQPLSGTTTNLKFGAEYRISESQTRRTTLVFALEGNFNTLSAAAKVKAPGVRGSDYNFLSANTTLAHSFVAKGMRAPTDLTATLGRFWYAGTPLSNNLRLGVAQGFPIKGNGALITIFGSAEHQSRLDNGRRSANSLTFGGEFSRALKNGAHFQIGFSLSDTSSDAKEVDNRAATLSASYSTSNLLPGLLVTGEAAVFGREYGPSLVALSGRSDRGANLSLSLTFTEKHYMGFAPAITFTASNVTSNADLYDRRDLGISFGLKSAF